MKYQVLHSLKNNGKILKTVGLALKGYEFDLAQSLTFFFLFLFSYKDTVQVWS